MPGAWFIGCHAEGKQRIWGISHCIRRQFEENGEFRDVHMPATGKVATSPEDKIRQLEHQVGYLTQEVEFLKKFPRSEVPESRRSIMHDSSCVFENKMHGYTKGAKGIYMALLHMEPPVIMNLKKIRRLMDKFNLSCPIRKQIRIAGCQSTQNKQCSRESPAKRIRMLRPTDGTADRYHISAV